MAKVVGPHPVKLFVGMLSNDESLFATVKQTLENVFGPCDLDSPLWPWEHTTYYEKEMGAGLKRRFVFFEKLIMPDAIAEIKLKTIVIEKEYLYEQGGRKINLDPGYLDSAKIVLVSTKDFSHRIYLNNGIYGEVTLIYSGKDYQTLPYTFPDFMTAEYQEVFKQAREIFKKKVKNGEV
jgi:hypothetical protein